MTGDAFGIIYAGQQIFQLRDLVDKRAVGALPIAGRYRVIDFMLSNLVNSGVRNVAVITGRNYNSLMDHLGSGKAWDLSRKSDGLFIIPPYAVSGNPGIYRGSVEALKASMDYISRAKQDYCIISGAYTIFNIDFENVVRNHIEKGADITVLYNKLENSHRMVERYDDVRFKINSKGEVKKVERDVSSPTLDCLSMDTFVIRRDILSYLVDDCISRGEYHIAENLIGGHLDSLKVIGWEHKGYVGRLHNVASYFAANMDMLDCTVRMELFRGHGRVYTKIKDEVPAKYMPLSKVSNSLIANGCTIEGEVENSILFRSVYVGKGTTIRNSIIMEGTEVNDDVELEYVILDKDVTIRNRTRLVGNPNFPVVIKKGAIV